MAFFIERPIPERPYFKVGEAAHILGVAPSTVRYWQKEFPDHIKAELSRSGQNVFSRCDVIVMAVILNLVRTEGMAIKDARAKLTDLINEHGGRIDRIQLCLQFELPLQSAPPAALVLEPVEVLPEVPAEPDSARSVATVTPAPDAVAPDDRPVPTPVADSQAIEAVRAELGEELARLQAELDHQLSIVEFLAEDNRQLRASVAALRAENRGMDDSVRATIHAILDEINS